VVRKIFNVFLVGGVV